ncbi:hypothetical protein E2C01_053786 [Portunus trituberculatus]|uniref:Uncharacterized protein n=1 Tax=Portunus trituberculatus TaxID=210409 RepID=A0A5B7GRR6_PORTR|nr:hypothetical protein [Portunus trituberculatus]
MPTRGLRNGDVDSNVDPVFQPSNAWLGHAGLQLLLFRCAGASGLYHCVPCQSIFRVREALPYPFLPCSVCWLVVRYRVYDRIRV